MSDSWDESGGPYRVWSTCKDSAYEIMKRMKQSELDKMSEYKTLDEIFPDGKPNGRKFTQETMDGYFVPYFKSRLRDWCGHDELMRPAAYDEIFKWKEYHPPKQTKKVKMYRPVVLQDDGVYIEYPRGKWSSYKDETIGIKGHIEIEIEVTE